MCIAIAKQAGLAIQEEILRTCFDNNPDGAGFCTEVDGNLVINKGYFTFEDFYTAFLPYENEKALIHFRIRTHGDTDTDNCHPFRVSDNMTFIHNGIIGNVSAPGKESDTIVFNKNYLQPIVSKYGEQELSSPIFKKLIENFIGASKLAFLIKGQEEFVIFNESMGNKSKEGVWFSNMSWQPRKVITSHRWKSQQVPSHTPNSNLCLPSGTYEKKEVDYLELMTGEILSFGTAVEVTYPITTSNGVIPKGAWGDIVRVYDNRTVDVDFYIEGEANDLYPYALKVCDWDNNQLNTRFGGI